MDFHIGEAQCTARYTYNNTTSVSITVNTDTLVRLFQK